MAGQRMRLRCWAVGLMLLCLLVPRASADSLLQPNDRIIFIGDSITGQGQNYSEGFKRQMEWALQQEHPDWPLTLIPLGGSGQSVASWLSVEKNSRETEVTLDVKGVGVKATLDQPADVVIIMLGMNDLLAPYVSERLADQDAWVKSYRDLIANIRARLNPRVFAVATITLCTEDPASPKNRMREVLNKRLVALAAEDNCVVIRTGEATQDMLATGRTYRPDFHVTLDFVHPDTAGHTAVAMEMLKALGEGAAAQRVSDRYLPAILKAAAPDLPALSYRVDPVDVPLGDSKQTWDVTCWWTGGEKKPSVRLQAPAGWTVKPATIDDNTGVFKVTGTPDRITTPLSLVGTEGPTQRTVEIALPAPWLIGAGVLDPGAWPGQKFDPESGKLPFESALVSGQGLGSPAEANGQQLTWRRYYPSVDFTGLADPANVDMYANTFSATFEAGCAARWVYSAKERDINVLLGSNTFAGNIGLVVWLNGTQVYSGVITSEPGKTARADGHLHVGWNRLLARTNHLAWQWESTCSLAGKDEADTLDDLRYAATPKCPAKR